MLTLSRHWSAKSRRALLSISLAGHGQLVKMLITLEPHGLFSFHFAYLHFKAVFGILNEVK